MAESILRNREDVLQQVIDNVPAMIAYIDTDLRYRFVNQQYVDLVGIDADAIIGKRPEEFLDSEVFGFARPMMEQVLTGVAVQFENKIILKDGRRSWVSVKFAPDFEAVPSAQAGKAEPENRVVRGFYALMVDIDERKRAEEAQEESEQRFRDIVSASSDWFWELDADFKMSYLSDRAEVVGGIQIEQMIGKTPWSVNDPDGQDRFWRECRGLIEAHAAFRDLRCQYKGSADGKVHHAALSGLPLFDVAGTFIGYRGSANDITKELDAIKERERVQDFFVKALEMLNVNFALYDPDEVMIYRNDTFKKFAKGAGWNIGLGDRYEDLLKEIMASGAVEEMVGREQEWIEERLQSFRALGTDEQGAHFRVRYRWLDGSIHWTDSSRIRTAEGYTLAGNIDVTDLVAREEQLRQAQKMEAVGQLTGGIAHDFNNILAVVLGNLDLLTDHLDELPECSKLTFKAIRAAERGALLTQRLLAFSRQQPLMPTPTNINALVNGIEELLRGALGEQHELEFVRAAGLWRCEVDPSQVENAVLNLAINARDSMQSGGRLTIETANAHLDDEYAAAQVELSPGQYVMLAVTDTGCGMPPDVKARIFEPFFTTKEIGQGSGLGLSMVYGFVKQSGGHISVYSEEGEGTTIKIYLPRAIGQDEPNVVQSHRPGDSAGRGQRVLVVEDEQLVRELTRDLLEDLGYAVVTADTGRAALEILEGGEAFEVLLSDAVLPGGMNGRQLAEAVKERWPAMRVLYMSGYTENAIIHHGRLDRDAVLLQKPFRKKDLALKMREVLTQEMPEDKARDWGD
ncbi:PAS domain-containing hybrid sensor histidine kinase/response regulator [Denitrobaculum tricleocarpae]|uniref:histidine kinase n=1 Tax=Denitrobaculum tricleocarpae TaxID=2591009 RepID=A0A545TKW4_9PROT|nr:PAS domain S-box protein [Denitrobaculum tricleocarpae]TQV77838.1 PAS domain S-box protein [Denitrobaculum tricleocarpae]